MMTSDAWDPEQYERFKTARTQPAHDLLSLLSPVRGGRAVDLGCGTGEITVELHDRLGLESTVGIDTSPAMLERAPSAAGVRFKAGDLRDEPPERELDVVFANASLQWVPDHRAVLTGWTSSLREGGQLAVQVPANADHASHRCSSEVAMEEPFLSAFGGAPPPDPVRSVLRPEEYAELLHELGYTHQHVRLQVYGNVMPNTSSVVEWVKGTSLTRFRALLDDDMYALFVERYRARLLAELGDRQPYFYAFKRILFVARR